MTTGQGPVQLTRNEELALESGAELSPAKLNDALDKKLAFVTSNLALIATITAGFGLFSDVGGHLRDNEALRLALGLLIVAVVVSLVGSMPNWFKSVDLGDPDSIQNYYHGRLLWRSWAARIAILLFVVAVAITAWAVVDVANDEPVAAPKYSVQFVSGSARTAAASFEVAGASAGDEYRVHLAGCARVEGGECPRGRGSTLATARAVADAAGKASVSLAVDQLGSRVRYLVLTVSGPKVEPLPSKMLYVPPARKASRAQSGNAGKNS